MFIFTFFTILFEVINAHRYNTLKNVYISLCYDLNGDDNHSLDSNGLLTVKGKGEMCDCNSQSFTHKFDTQKVKSIKFTEATTTIGEECFANFKETETIELSNTIVKIKENAFYNTGITHLTITKNTQIIEENAFKNNKKLKTSTCNIPTLF